MKKLILLALLTSILAFASTPLKLGAGLKFSDLQIGFNKSADRDKEAAIRLKSCKVTKTQRQDLQGFTCSIADAGYISGTAETTGAVRGVSISFIATDAKSITDFQRSGKYLIYATQGQEALGALSLVAQLMNRATKKPNVFFSEELNGIRYSAMWDIQREPVKSWVLGAEPMVK